ncbi:ester cyclase [Paraglaciecola sp.]|uniref:ester cyclase n=1 Tax=Paraglaciecola sp. TaxID=1920173 RepID=UPI0030F41E9C
MRQLNIVYLAFFLFFTQCHEGVSASELSINSLTATSVKAQNKMLARRVYEEGLSQGIFRVPYTFDFIGHGGGTNTFTHEDGIKEAKGWRVAFPDLKVEVDLILAEDDLVSVRWTARGVNSQAGMGIPATGKQVQTSGTTVFRFVNGAIAEEWTAGDALGLLRQLGLMPEGINKQQSGE